MQGIWGGSKLDLKDESLTASVTVVSLSSYLVSGLSQP